MICCKGKEIKVLHSAAGYYLGTEDKGMPNCRITSTYTPRKEEAMALPIDREDAMENIFCNGCGRCKIRSNAEVLHERVGKALDVYYSSH